MFTVMCSHRFDTDHGAQRVYVIGQWGQHIHGLLLPLADPSYTGTRHVRLASAADVRMACKVVGAVEYFIFAQYLPRVQRGAIIEPPGIRAASVPAKEE